MNKDIIVYEDVGWNKTKNITFSEYPRTAKKKCKTCGYKKTCHKSICKAIGKKCSYCSKLNHFPKSLNCKAMRKRKKLNKLGSDTQKSLVNVEVDDIQATLTTQNAIQINKWIKKQEIQESLDKSFYHLPIGQRFFLVCFALFNLQDLLNDESSQLLTHPKFSLAEYLLENPDDKEYDFESERLSENKCV